MMKKEMERKVAINALGAGTHDGTVNRTTDAAFTARHLLAIVGTTLRHIAVGTATGRPLGTVPDEPASGDLAAVHLLGIKPSTLLMVAAGNITAGDLVYTAAAGKVSVLSATPGTYFLVGRALQGAAADEQVEVQHCFPVATVVPE
jgi:hypothetical protein